MNRTMDSRLGLSVATICSRLGVLTMLKAIVFDMDGTITVLKLPLEAMRRDTKKYYISRGFPHDQFETSDGISSSTGKARNYFLANGYSEDDWKKMESEMDTILSRHEGFAAVNASEIEGSLDIIKKIRDVGLKTAILTNNGRPALDKILEQIPLGEHFDLIHTRHESPKPKPYPDGLLKVSSELGVDESEVVFVGDALIDGAAATRAGIEFWGVSTGETSSEKLYEAGASKVFTSLSGVLEAALDASRETL
ncbi:MAG: HAD family hydrolase [Candidatus Thorarchaeota archaeon]|nr:MAG: HAD family hydrolase [Candidatus Thorarchaeota archaeon]